MQQATSHHSGIRSTIPDPVRRVASLLVDFVLPPACTFCTRDLQHDFEATVDRISLCGKCRRKFTSDERSACLKCGMPVGPYVDTSQGCPECSRRHFRFDQVIRLGVYDDALRTACIRGKSRGAEALAASLALMLLKERRSLFAEFAPDIIVPIPQHWLHWFTRPHHQALTMAEVLAEDLEVPCDNRIVRKSRLTVDQSNLPRSKRLTNLHQAYRIRRHHNLAGKRVLIVDDILTTGTTSNEVAKVLRKAGVTSVAVAVIAVVP
jgi:ComF family protein